jgi:transcriptional regulator with PAS, ATPase and Fis domain
VTPRAFEAISAPRDADAAAIHAYPRLRAAPAAPAAEVIGGSAEVLAALRMARRVADSTATLLIQGESGTGKGWRAAAS